MIEDQTIEFKESWRDENLKTICAFANSDGGTIYIGIDDSGNGIGVANANKLLEDLPNKIVSCLGILPEIKIEEQNTKQILTIRVNKNMQPVSYHGRFYVRSGSTTQELRGTELQQFILKANNLTWDAIPVPEAKFEDLNERLVRYFVGKAIDKNRLSIDAELSNSFDLLQKLNLITEHNELTRAAVILFAKRPTKYIRGVAFKVGRFGKDSSDLISHDIVECPVFEMPDRVLELLKTKYLHSKVSYEGIDRIETLEYPEKAIRESVLNAIIHRDYSYQGTEITLHVYDNELVFWNIGSLLAPLSVEMLKVEHPSVRRNVLIADIFYRSGAIEAWGRGIKLIISESQKNNFPPPSIRMYAGGMELVISKNAEDTNKDTNEDTNELTPIQKQILKLVSQNNKITIHQLSLIIGINVRNMKNNISKIKNKGLMMRVGSSKTGFWNVQK